MQWPEGARTVGRAYGLSGTGSDPRPQGVAYAGCMTYKFRVLLLLPLLWAFSGCRSQFAARTPDEELAAQQVSFASAVESEQASVVFARKSLELTLQQQETGQVSPKRVALAEADLQVAQTMLKIDQQRQEALAEYLQWKTFAKTPVMTEAAHQLD